MLDAGVGGWNGHRYWMAFTPFPSEPRENPSVVASNNGITWVVPNGLANPVISRAESQADGYDYNSDTELIFDGSTLVMFYRPAGGAVAGEAVYSVESTNGVTWTNKQQLISNPAGGGLKLLSPAVVREADSTWMMWTVDDDNQQVLRRTSADRLTWSAPSVCTIPALRRPWHLTVLLVDGEYHMLMNSAVGDRLFYYHSTDGLTWDGSTDPAVPLVGTDYRHYRSAMVHVGTRSDGAPLWDVWSSGIPTADGTGTWLLSFHRNVAFWRGLNG